MAIGIGSERALFDMSEEIAFFNCASVAPLPIASSMAGEAGMRIKTQPWRIESEHFFTGPDRARGLVAPLMNARADDIAIVPSTGYGITMAAEMIPLSAGSEIILLADEFPSNIYPWHRRARETGALIRRIAPPRDTGLSWAEAILEAVNPRTAVIAAPHYHWTDGSLVDLETVGAAARRHGAALVLDLAQSLGAAPIDVTRVQPDFAVAPCYKWLLGPYSLGFAYAAPHRQQGRPLEESWIARQGAEDFTRLADYHDNRAEGARRYDMGARAQLHLLPAAIASLEQILDWSVEAVAATLSEATRLIADRALALDLDVPAQGTHAPHFIGVRFPRGVPEDLVARLHARSIYVSLRGDVMRLAPHLFTTRSDIDRLFRELKAILA